MEQFLSDKTKHDFDLELVYDALKMCYSGPGDSVDLAEYLRAYHELCRFFQLSGRLFGFVGKDLEHKLSVLEEKRKGGNSIHYQTVQAMIQYEVNSNLALNRGSKMSGSRTLLRLQWALEFILEFISRLSISDDDSKISVVAAEVYERTLSKHHPWITRKMAAFAMYFLPSRKELISAMCKHDYETVLGMLGKVVTAGRSVHARIQDIYTEFDLLNIP